MLVDLDTAGDDLFAGTFDVCISGSGPAGIPLALKLAGKGHRVLLLEAGDLQFSVHSNQVYQGSNSGLPYFAADVCRQRFFGGTSNHWGGWCRELGENDFQVREQVPYSGWPIGKADLAPYAAEAARILHVHTPDVEDYLLQGGTDTALRQTAFQYSEPPARLGDKFRKAVRDSDTLLCVLNANLVDIALGDKLDTVGSLQLADYSGTRYRVHAAQVVLCHGGIENPRTLLNANRQMRHGIGNDHDLVGRFFMDHPHFVVASGIVNHEHPGLKRFSHLDCNTLRAAIYEPSEAFQSQQKTLNFGLRFVPQPGMCKPDAQISFQQRLKQLVAQGDDAAQTTHSGKPNYSANCRSDMCFKTASEQSPNPASRIRLGADRDRFGKRRVMVDWQLNALDKHTLRQSALQGGKVMASRDLGRVRLPEWLLDPGLEFPTPSQDEVAGCHHMGTTRMADSPQRGVVDKNQRVFGIDNLYLGGSSVFATSGHVNPTFTIVQMSLRLGDHLDSILRKT
jgi:choline dehydrogenase-like flavoprotein